MPGAAPFLYLYRARTPLRYTGFVEEANQRPGERAEVEAEYRRVLKSAVEFEKRIRNRWREKNREKNRRIAELEARVSGLEYLLNSERVTREDAMDRSFKERKMVALILNDFGAANVGEAEIEGTREEVRGLSDEELDRTLAERFGLSYPADEGELEFALNGVEEPERLSEGTTGAPDMSHNPGLEEG